jgi:hypothetical protein
MLSEATGWAAACCRSIRPYLGAADAYLVKCDLLPASGDTASRDMTTATPLRRGFTRLKPPLQALILREKLLDDRGAGACVSGPVPSPDHCRDRG